MSRTVATLFFLVSMCSPCAPARAQAIPGADMLSRAAVAESLKVLAQLGDRVKQNSKDAPAWYHRGMIAFALSERTWSKDTIPGLDYRKLRLMAADAFAMAEKLDVMNDDYVRMARLFHLASHSQLDHSGGRGATCNADLKDYEKIADMSKRIQDMLYQAWVCWLDYDGYADRAMSSFADFVPRLGSTGKPELPGAPKDAAPQTVLGAGQRNNGGVDSLALPLSMLLKAAIDSIVATLKELPFDVAGELDYLRADKLLRAVIAADPGNEQAYHRLAMLVVARDNWAALEQLAYERTQRAPNDAWGWMSLALARYRLKPGKDARAEFDAAFARLSAADRARLDRLERVLRPKDARSYANLDAASRANAARVSWLLADPLWSVPTADPRTEFLARATFAELRWSVPEQSAHGIDTDRGDIYVRYGPPKRMLGYQPPMKDTMVTFWVYNADLVFSFGKLLHLGTAIFPKADSGLFREVEAWQPARWDNIATVRIDSMPTQAVRFRAAGDSVDFFLATRAPLDTMRAVTASNAQALTRYWLYSQNSPAMFTDSLTMGASPDLRWTRRVAPGPYYYRVESTVLGGAIAGRTAATTMLGRDSLTGFATRGFGVSDILVAASATDKGAPQRWSDVSVTPQLGDLQKGATFSVVWETYELARDGASASYDVAISLRRRQSNAGRIMATIVSRLPGVGVITGKDNIEFRVQRIVPFAAALTDNIAISLGTTPPDTYLLSVAVTDRVTHRTTTRTQYLTVRP